MQSPYALLVIDMQLCGFDGEITPPIENGDQLLDKVASLIKICRSNKIPIVFVQTCAFPGQPYAKDMHGWEIHPNIPPEPEDRIVYKRNSSAFDDTDLHALLVELEVKGLITCGIWSEFCVTSTSMSAIELGFDVYVAADAHGTLSNDELEASDIISKQNDYLKQNQAHISDVHELRKIRSFGLRIQPVNATQPLNHRAAFRRLVFSLVVRVTAGFAESGWLAGRLCPLSAALPS